MNCKNCGAPMKFDHEKIYFSCDYCTSIYFPEETKDGIRVTDEVAGMPCPVCELPLVFGYADKLRVFTCTKCRGILIDQQSFVRVIQYLRSKASGASLVPPPMRMEELERNITCPRCHRKMDTHPYGGPGNIVIDNCPRCNYNWLDHNEMYRITHTAERSQRGRNIVESDDRLFRPRKKFKD